MFYGSTKNYERVNNGLEYLIAGDIKPRFAPEFNQKYWTVGFNSPNSVQSGYFGQQDGDYDLLNMGLIFKTKEEAIKFANNILNNTKGVIE